DQDVALAARVDAAVGEDAEVGRLAAPLRDDDLHGSGVEHRRAAHSTARAAGDWPGDHDLAFCDARDLAGDGERLAHEIDLRHVDLAAQRQGHAGRGPGRDDAPDALWIADGPGHHVVETL